MKSINIDGFKKLSMRPFKEVTKARFWEMLECLPPRIQATNGFLVGEAYDHKDGRPVYECYVQEADKYFNVGLMNLRTFEFYLTDRTDKRICKICGDELSPLDDLKCGYHDLE